MRRENQISKSSLGGLKPTDTFPSHDGLGTIPDWLHWRSTVTPETLAIKCNSTELTFSELQEDVSNLSGRLVALGIEKGNRVCLLLEASILYISLVHALTRIGAIVVPLNPRQSASEILLEINDCSPSLVLHDELFAQIVKGFKNKYAVHGGIKLPPFRTTGELRENRRDIRKIEAEEIERSSPHSIIYTSGSSGSPKGVVLSASNLMWNAISFGFYHGALPSDRWLLVMPLYHVGGYSIIFRSVLLGSGIVIHSEFEASAVSRSIDQDKVTLVSLVPTMLERLLRIRKKSFAEKLRLIFLGGSHTPLPLINEIIRRKLPVLMTYGMTESCSQIAISKVCSGLRSGGQNTYHAMFPTTMKIRFDKVETHKKKRNRSSHNVGKIMLRGPSIFQGYWKGNRVEPRASKIGNDWFDSGDIGYMDSNRRIVILGRENEMIISGGENIYPIEVESPLLEHKAVQEVVVIGREDSKWGQRVEAVLKIRPNFNAPSTTELNKFLRDKIGSYKIPKEYHFLNQFPKTESGKTKRETIRVIIEKMEGKQGAKGDRDASK